MSVVAKNKSQYNQPMTNERDRKSLLAINLGLGINIFLAFLKTIFGILGHSPALLAEGINSTSDVAYYIAASIFVRLANKPADSEHPYGHRQMESIASVVIGSFIVATAVAVFWDSMDKVWDLADGLVSSQGAHPFALWVAIGTVVIKIFLTKYIRRLGRETQNPVVDALAYDHRNDLFSASAAAIGIFLGQRGLPWVDPLAGAFVAFLIMRTGIFVLRESSSDLMGVVPNRDLAEHIAALLKTVSGCLLYTSPSQRDRTRSRMPSSACKKTHTSSNGPQMPLTKTAKKLTTYTLPRSTTGHTATRKTQI